MTDKAGRDGRAYAHPEGEAYVGRTTDALRTIFDDLHNEDAWLRAAIPVDVIAVLKDLFISEAATMRIGAIRELRADYSAKEIGDRLGITRSRVTQLENK